MPIISANHELAEIMQASLAMHSTKSSSMNLDMKTTTKIFQHFSTIYLNKWTDQFSDEQMLKAVIHEWTLGLRGLTQEQIMRGVDGCRINEAWPPSIADFIKYAIDTKSLPLQSKAFQPWLTLPRPTGDPAIAQEAIKQIKRDLL